MTAAALGFADSYIATTKNPIQFDIDPLVAESDREWTSLFKAAVQKLDAAVGTCLTRKGIAPSNVKAGTSPGYTEGATIMGVYKLAGEAAPQSVSAPELSEKGKALWEKIRKNDVKRYTGRGAYTGFVDHKNTVGDTDPVGPRSTARLVAPAPGLLDPDPHPHWLPPLDSPLWKVRQRKVEGTYVPSGMIGGEKAGLDSSGTGTGATNDADQVTRSMQHGGIRVLCRRLLRRPPSEPGRLCHGNGRHE